MPNVSNYGKARQLFGTHTHTHTHAPALPPALQVLPDATSSAENTDYVNSLKEYGLSTPTPPPTSSASYFGQDAADTDGTDASAGSAPAAAAAGAAADTSAEEEGAPTGATPSGADAVAQGLGGLSLGGTRAEEQEKEQAETAAAARGMMSRRRREEEETSLAAVGACLVSSSVRKDGKVRPHVFSRLSGFVLCDRYIFRCFLGWCNSGFYIL